MSPMAAANPTKAIIRSLTPFVIGAATATLAHFGWHLSAEETSDATVVVGFVLTGVVQAGEARFPWLGFLAGIRGVPIYQTSKRQAFADHNADLRAKVAQILSTRQETP
jgi:hypothetical protein